jgi:hypothetical protein
MKNKICTVVLGVKIQETKKEMENSEYATVQSFIQDDNGYIWIVSGVDIIK